MRGTGLALSWMALAALAVLGDGCRRAGVQRRPAPALRLERNAAASKSSAPPAAALPAAAAIQVGAAPDPQNDYELLDDALYMGDAFGDAPPDYAVMHATVEVWVWRSLGDAMLLVEPVAGGGYRHYYFKPGLPTPFLVRDDAHAYGFDGPDLVAAYDASGRVLGAAELSAGREEAGRLRTRGEQLRLAALRTPIRSVAAVGWAEAQPRLSAARAQWDAAVRELAAWRTVDTAHAVEQTTYWKSEQERRRRSAERFERWRVRGFRGAPPPPVEGADGRSEALRKAGLPAPSEAEAQ